MYKTKNIRISERENKKWNSKLVHSVLHGDYKFLYDILVKIKMKKEITPEEIERVEQIEELFENEQ